MASHKHQTTTNGDRYRCPVRDCWWQATGVQALPGPSGDSTTGLYGSGDHPDGGQYGPADMTMYDQHRSDER